MLIWQSTSVQRKSVEALASYSNGPAECLVRDDGKGSYILCERGTAPKTVIERQMNLLSAIGRTGPDAGPWVFLVKVQMPQAFRNELCAWYQCEHGPMLLECPEWRGFQCFEISTKHECQLYVLHRLAARSALDSVHRKCSRDTPWFHRLARNDWFGQAFERMLLHRMSLVWN